MEKNIDLGLIISDDLSVAVRLPAPPPQRESAELGQVESRT